MATDFRPDLVSQAARHAAQLLGCPKPHVFEDLPAPSVWARCRRCLGEVHQYHAEWYRRGVADAERAALRQRG